MDAFLVKTNALIKCVGCTPNLYSGTPLILEGEYRQGRSDTFEVTGLSLDTTDKEKLIKLLSGRNFKHVGTIKAEQVLLNLARIAEEKNADDFGKLEYEDIKKAVDEAHICTESADKMAMFLAGIRARTALYEQIKEFGGCVADAEKMYQEYGGGALLALNQDPYIGLKCKLSLNLCDQIAIKQGVSPLSKKRIMGIGSILSDKIKHDGSCCIEFSKALDCLQRIQRTGAYPLVSGFTILAVLLDTPDFISIKHSKYGYLLYPAELYKIEEEIAKQLHRLNSNPTETGYTEYNGAWTPDPDQLRGIDLIKTTGVKIITGGPGTGKTSVIKAIIEEYKAHQKHNSILLCAPTGAAAARISQSLNDQYKALTINKLIDTRTLGGNEYIYMFNRSHQLPLGLYVIDEMSMVGEDLFQHLLEAIPSGSVVILSGDVDQLQSVTAGTVLQDLIDSNVFETVRLTQVHRQEGESLILKNYYHLKNNDMQLESGDSCQIINCENRTQMMEKVAELFGQHKFQCQILSTTRKGYMGKDNIDYLITQARLGSHKQYKTTPFLLGDKIMMTHNNYEDGYFNGDAGIITDFTDEGVRAQFYGGMLTLNDENLLDAEHAWCCTIYKAQGNEYDTVVLIIDDEYENMLYRSILLTGITRARKKLYIITKDNALKKCMTGQEQNLRITGLSEVLNNNVKSTSGNELNYISKAAS